MLNIDYRVDLAKRCFKFWESEQNETAIEHYNNVEDFFSRHIYSEIVDLRSEDSECLGELMKHLLELIEEELENVNQERERSLLELRKERAI